MISKGLLFFTFLLLPCLLLAQTENVVTSNIIQEESKFSNNAPFVKEGTVIGIPQSINALTLETFDGVFPPAGWTVVIVSGTTQYWIKDSIYTGYGMSSGAAKFNFFSAAVNNVQYLQTPTFAASTVNEVLEFDYSWNAYTTTTKDTLIFQTSTNGTDFTDWKTYISDSAYANLLPDNLLTGPKSSASPGDSYWATKRLPLPVGTVAIRFLARSGYGTSFYMDNLKVYTPPAPAAAMTGIYTVNPTIPASGTNYQNFTAMAADLSARGVSGPVTINVYPTNYSERFYIRPITGTSATNKVTINAANATLYVKNDRALNSNTGDYGIAFIGCDWVTLDGLTIIDSGATVTASYNTRINRGIVLGSYAGQDGSRNITIKNVNIKLGGGGTVESASTGIVGTGNMNGAIAGTIDSVTIMNCKIDQSDRGIGAFTFTGLNSFPYPGYTRWIIDGNTLGSSVGIGSNLSTSPIGIILSGVQNAMITNNVIDTIRILLATGTGAITGISMQISSGYVYNNKIKRLYNSHPTNATALLSAMQVGPYPEQATYIYNNTITGISRPFTGTASATLSTYGLYTTNFVTGIPLNSPVYVYNNSIYLNLNAPGITSAAYRNFGSTLPVYCFNNSFINASSSTGLGYAYAVYDATPAASNRAPLMANYNNLVASGTNARIGYYSAGLFAATLKDWKTGGGFVVDTNSVSGMPVFADSVLLRPDTTSAANWVLNGRGIANTLVANDIRGLTRNTLRTQGSTDIGAFEFGMTVAPPDADLSGTLAIDSTAAYTAFGDTVLTVKFTAGTVPSSLSVKNYPGVTPPGAASLTNAKYAKLYNVVTPTGGSGYTYTVSNYYSYALQNNVEAENFFTMARSTNNGTLWIHMGDAVVDTAYNKVTKTGLTAFATFALDHSNAGLPVELTSFTSSVNANNVDLKWVTKSESNNKGFAVERKLKDDSYEEIAFVKGNGTTVSEHKYSYSDSKVADGKYVYRLRQVDFNGAISYSKEIEVEVVTPIEFALHQNYPNPFNPSTTIKYAVPQAGLVKLHVYNSIGEVVTTLVNQNVEAGNYEVNFNASNLSSGIYFYKLETGKFTAVKKLMLIK